MCVCVCSQELVCVFACVVRHLHPAACMTGPTVISLCRLLSGFWPLPPRAVKHSRALSEVRYGTVQVLSAHRTGGESPACPACLAYPGTPPPSLPSPVESSPVRPLPWPPSPPCKCKCKCSAPLPPTHLGTHPLPSPPVSVQSPPSAAHPHARTLDARAPHLPCATSARPIPDKAGQAQMCSCHSIRL